MCRPTEEEALNATISVWIALSRNPATIDRLVALERRRRACTGAPLEPRPGFAGWSDDHASILPIINYPSLPCFGAN